MRLLILSFHCVNKETEKVGKDKLGELLLGPRGKWQSWEIRTQIATPAHTWVLHFAFAPGTSVCLFCYSLYEDIEAMK